MKAREFLARKVGDASSCATSSRRPLSVEELRRLASRVGGWTSWSPQAPRRGEGLQGEKLLRWLAEDGARVRRPIVVTGRKVTLGFAETARKEWRSRCRRHFSRSAMSCGVVSVSGSCRRARRRRRRRRERRAPRAGSSGCGTSARGLAGVEPHGLAHVVDGAVEAALLDSVPRPGTWCSALTWGFAARRSGLSAVSTSAPPGRSTRAALDQRQRGVFLAPQEHRAVEAERGGHAALVEQVRGTQAGRPRRRRRAVASALPSASRSALLVDAVARWPNGRARAGAGRSRNQVGDRLAGLHCASCSAACILLRQAAGATLRVVSRKIAVGLASLRAAARRRRLDPLVGPALQAAQDAPAGPRPCG